jgi:S-DNA-T family DNA segregation ATPase FtsK/SpoIIIE
VYIHDVIDSPAFRNHDSKVAFALGKDIGGNCIVGDIAKLPHLLIAGTTGSGKSVCTNSLIISLLYKATPEEVRLIMVDPKMVELGIYNGIPHLLIPVVTDPKKAAGALQWAVTEMMKRYRAFSEVGVRDLKSYNAHAARQPDMEKMPQIVVVIDELADLMLVAAKEVEESICRVAQMGRAAGMHLVIATQRPSSDVITGLMKANIPSRIAFAVASALESRIILDTMGAEKLVGRGDMLYAPLGVGKPTRVQGCLISDQEVADVVEFVKRSGAAQYDDSVLHEIEQHASEKEKGSKGTGGSAPEGVDSEYDELLPAAIEVVLEVGQASVSMLQRRLKLGYSRAARLVDQMEEKGVVGPFEGSKARQILITKEQWQEMQFKQGLHEPPPADPVPEEFPFEGDAVEQERDQAPFDL